MKATHELVQGSPEWDQFRLMHNGASEAAAMLGLSKKTRRTELLHMKHTGNAKEFSVWVRENILDHGHRVEAMARPHVEALVGDDLYPVTLSNGKLSASCDGLNMADTIAFEHKQWNEESAALVRQGIVPPEHMPQCQQVLMVSEAERLIFVVSDGTPENMVHVDVLPDPEWFERIRAGWEQFDKDLAAYVPPTHAEPVRAGKAPKTLPALRLEVTGAVTASNLAEFKATALEAIRGVNRELKTDEDFADAAESVKWCSDVESRLTAAKEHALSQTTSLDELFKTIDDIGAEARTVRLELDKLVTRRKAEIKDAIVLKAKAAYDEHVTGLKAETEDLWINLTPPDFAGAAKNKRSFASLQDAVDVVLANAKIEADASAKRIRAALTCIKTDGEGHELLFADRQMLVHKPIDDLKLIITSRIDAHKAAVDKARVAAEATAAAAVAVVAASAPASVTVTAVTATGFSVPASVRAAVLRPTAQTADTRPPITTGALCARFGEGFTVTAQFLTGLGITPADRPKEAKSGTYWREADFPRICAAISAHAQRVALGEPVAA